MNTELRKQLEEVFIKWLNEHRNETTIRNYEDETLAHFSFNAGVEYGYKEAIALAKEWLKEHSNTEHYSDGASYCDTPFAKQEDMLDTFDFDMNKLWEEKE